MTTFTATNGNDTFNGNSSSDQVTFSGSAAGYRIDLVNGFVQVVDIDSSDGDTGTDTLTGIETLDFADRNYTLEGELAQNSAGETRINTYTTGAQGEHAITALADGGYVITWTSDGQDGSSLGVYAQRYDENGLAVGSESRINTETIGRQEQSAIAALADGGYIVTWASVNDEIRAQRYAADGSAIGSQILVNTFIGSELMSQPAITSLVDGGYVITWASRGQDGSFEGIYAQRYAVDGSNVGSETKINTYTTSIQSNPAITALSDGGYVITWRSYEQDGSFDGVYAQRYAADGSTVGSEARINTYSLDWQTEPAITGLHDGGYIITWSSRGQDGSDYGVYAQRYAADGSPVGGETQINTTTANGQAYSTIASLADGGYILAWYSDGQDGDGGGIYAQRYNVNGVAVGTETRINTYTSNWQYNAVITELANGGYVITWMSVGQDGDGLGVYAQRFDAAGNPLANGMKITGTATADVLNGGAGIQTMIGLGGDDTLDGGSGADTLKGGGGNDTYILVDADTIIENAGAGTDTVQVYGSYALGSNLENLTLLGSSDVIVAGNTLDNVITGNIAGNILYGHEGNDTLDGGDSSDILEGGAGDDMYILADADTVTEAASAGTDTVKASFSYTLGSNLENLMLAGALALEGTGNGLTNIITGNGFDNILNGLGGNDSLYGNGGNDSLDGGSGSDMLSGGGGSDTLTGGDGNDIYILGDADTIIEGSSAGTDTVQTSIAYTLGDDLENLTLTAASAIDGIGNTLVNLIIGNTGNNTLFGLAGNDTLNGGGGDDTLLGGSGNDTLVGGSGDDIARYSGNAGGYRVDTLASGQYQVVDIDSSNGDTGTDILTGIEQLDFDGVRHTLGQVTSGSVQGEIRINTETTHEQSQAAITALTDGGYIISWTSDAPDDDFDGGIFAQRYNANGVAIGNEIHVNSHTPDWQTASAITALANGGYVIAWQSAGQDGSGDGIYAQRYNANGNTVGAEFRINTQTTQHQSQPAITALADGGYVVTWQSAWPDAPSTDIYAQRYNANGVAIGGETRINTHTSSSQEDAAIAALQDGGYVISWSSFAQDGSLQGVYAQRFNANGVAVGNEARINTTTASGQYHPAITALDDGGYIITWASDGQDTSGDAVYAQRFNAAGNAVGSETRINAHTISEQHQAAITTLANGAYVICWTSNGQDGSDSGIYAQRFSENGAALGAETRINTHTADAQAASAITALADGGYVITWTSVDQDGSREGVYAQRFKADGTAWGPVTLRITGSSTSDTLNAGSGGQNLSGAAGNDALNSGGGDDTLSGGDGNDKLIGGAGNDRLTGGADNDLFRFNTALNATSNVDIIADYAAANDTLQLDHAIFKKLSALGELKAGNFVASASGNAIDSNDYILYDTDSGKVFYDADGNGTGAKVQFALIGTSTHAALTASEFSVI